MSTESLLYTSEYICKGKKLNILFILGKKLQVNFHTEELYIFP